MTPAIVDARGLRCPWPAIRAARALRDGAPALVVMADDPAAAGELARLAATSGLAFAAPEPARFHLAKAPVINTLFTLAP